MLPYFIASLLVIISSFSFPPTGKLEVKLMDMGMSIAEKLVNEGHAVSTTGGARQFPSVTSEPGESVNP